MERLAHLEQLVVQLKGLIRDKDTQLTQKDEELANKDAQFKAGGRSLTTISSQASLWLAAELGFLSCWCGLFAEREGGARRSLHQTQAAGQGQDGFAEQADQRTQRTRRSNRESEWSRNITMSKSVRSDWRPFWSTAKSRELLYGRRRRGAPGAEEQAEWGGSQQQGAAGATPPHSTAAWGEGGRPRRAGDLEVCQFSDDIYFEENLWTSCVFVPQLLKLQAVVCEKDVRFQEQVQKHEEELLNVTAQSRDDAELQQVQEVRNTQNDLIIGFQRNWPFRLVSSPSQFHFLILLQPNVSITE